MAEAYLKKKADLSGLDLEVESAGTNPVQGMFPPAEAIERIENRSDFENREARQVTPEMLARADLVLVMEEHHRKRLIALSPSETNKIHHLLDFDPAPDQHHCEMGIPDPYRMSGDFYDNVNEIIRRCCDEVVKALKAVRD